MANKVAEKFKNNSKGFFEKYKWLLVIFLISLCCDGISTVYFMYETGPEAELHPAVKYSSRIFGTVAGPMIAVVMKAVSGIAVAIYLRRYAVYILVAAAVISFWAAWYNVWGCQIYQPYFFRWLAF